MHKFIQIQRFAKGLFNNDQQGQNASRIILRILKAKSPHLSGIEE
jgi:hypothetical protein